MRDVVIAGACRTPIGSFQGSLSSIPAPRLGAIVIAEAVRRAGIAPADVQEVIMGNVIQAGVGQAPARQASRFAGLPDAVECMTINKVCGSGLKAVMLAVQAIQTGDADIVVAGGMESMSNAPYLLDKARMGNAELQDALYRDGLIDIYNNYLMGNAAEICARDCGISRESQDAYAIESYIRAQSAQKNGAFAAEIVPVEIAGRKGDVVTVTEDEDVTRTNFAKIPSLRPAFEKNGTITAANASKVSDGAAAVVVMSAEAAARLKVRTHVRVLRQASAAKAPEWFTTAPADAIARVLARAGLSVADIDLFEINEAFAVVPLAVNTLAHLDPSRVNVHGGAISLGHPLGASGARILVTLIHALERLDKKRGLATLCIGGGEASALIVER